MATIAQILAAIATLLGGVKLYYLGKSVGFRDGYAEYSKQLQMDLMKRQQNLVGD